MIRLYNKDCDINNLNIPALAFIGDCVFELFVREKIVTSLNSCAKNLHEASIKQVCCKNQAEFAKKLIPILTEEELKIYNRGRNTNTKHTPKNSSVADYHSATGLESLFGFLYLKNDIERLNFLFEYCQDN